MTLQEELKQLWKNTKRDLRLLYDKVKEHPLFFSISSLAIIILVLILLLLPIWQVNYRGINNVTAEATLENQYRATLSQIVGGVAVLYGLYFAWGNLTTAREGQITERFTRAVEQLGSEKIETRLGAIYALERVANESDKDYWPIMEILTNFVRINSPVKDWDNEIQELKSPRSEYINDEYKVRVDIQAVINVIGRRRYFFGAKEQKPLYLRHTYLRMISLYDALNGAHLIGADLKGAHLERAFLDYSDLIGATFTGAYLEKTYFINSCLNFAQFDYARLKGAHLERCYLKIANFSNADLSDADLSDANLERANLKGAKNLTIGQLSKVKTLYNAKLDEELEKPLREKYPAIFDEPD